MKNLFQLGKISVMIPVSLSGFTGYFLFDPQPGRRIIPVTLAILFLAIASSVLNQIQEINIDARMDRTKKRPLPSGSMNLYQAWIFFALCLLGGSLMLYYYAPPVSLILGLFTIVWYNGVYTYLKRLTAFAVVPGSITGAMPPLIGWTAAGGYVFDLSAITLAFVFFMGQIPHFWLLLMQYEHEYKKADLPILTDIFETRQIKRLTYIWILAALISSLFLPAFGIISSLSLSLLLIVLIILLMFYFRNLLIGKLHSNYQKNYFVALNLYYLMLMLILISDKLF